MALPKQPFSLFFGATDQDTSRKLVQLGDLITAQEVRQVKGGEFSKRDGFGQIAQVYNGQASCAPDSVVTPDGVQVLTRDAATDHVFARSITNTLNQDQGHADRFVPYVRTRFPAVGTNEQAAPMAKQAGNYVVRLIDEGHFVVSQLNPATSAAASSPTQDAETIIQETASISVSTISSAASTKIKSFALVDHSFFDASNLWLIWVDWSAKVYAYKIPHANLSTGTFYTVSTFSASSPLYAVLTSVCAGMIDGPHMVVAACGVEYDTTAAYVSPGNAGGHATGFRTGQTEYANNYAKTISTHMYLANTGSLVGSAVAYTGQQGKMTAAACTIASVAGGFQSSNGTWFYAFIGNGTSGDWSIVLQKVTSATPATYSTYFQAFSAVVPDTYGLPLDWNANNFARYGWFYNGQLAAKETATGVDVAVTVIPYYVNQTTNPGTLKAYNPDYLFTQRWAFATSGGTWTGQWTKLGCCVAQGWLRLRDYASTSTSGKDYLLTIWEDKEALQTCYHLREWDTGEILAQLAYGQAAHVGHTATRDLQVQGYYSDVQQPMLYGVNQYNDLPLSILVGMQSVNQNASVDVAVLILQHWDFAKLAKPVWQDPAGVLGFAIAPGPITTIMSGFQRLREAGPLVYPSRLETYRGTGSS
jgi:hypothetical protein